MPTTTDRGAMRMREKAGRAPMVTSTVAHTQASRALRAEGVTVNDTTARETMRATQTQTTGAIVSAWTSATDTKPIALYPARAGNRSSIVGRERTLREANRGMIALMQHRSAQAARTHTGIEEMVLAHEGPSSTCSYPARAASPKRGRRHSEETAPRMRKQKPTSARVGASHWFSWRAEASLSC